MSWFLRSEPVRSRMMNCVRLRGGPGRYSYSKITVVRYHTMDLAYSPQNPCTFFRYAADRVRRVWYGGNQPPAALAAFIFDM
jgi:hypothetical protein